MYTTWSVTSSPWIPGGSPIMPTHQDIIPPHMEVDSLNQERRFIWGSCRYWESLGIRRGQGLIGCKPAAVNPHHRVAGCTWYTTSDKFPHIVQGSVQRVQLILDLIKTVFDLSRSPGPSLSTGLGGSFYKCQPHLVKSNICVYVPVCLHMHECVCPTQRHPFLQLSWCDAAYLTDRWSEEVIQQ